MPKGILRGFSPGLCDGVGLKDLNEDGKGKAFSPAPRHTVGTTDRRLQKAARREPSRFPGAWAGTAHIGVGS